MESCLLRSTIENRRMLIQRLTCKNQYTLWEGNCVDVLEDIGMKKDSDVVLP